MKYHLLYVLVRGVNSQEFVVVWVVCSPTLSGFIRSFNVILSSSKLLPTLSVVVTMGAIQLTWAFK